MRATACGVDANATTSSASAKNLRIMSLPFRDTLRQTAKNWYIVDVRPDHDRPLLDQFDQCHPVIGHRRLLLQVQLRNRTLAEDRR